VPLLLTEKDVDQLVDIRLTLDAARRTAEVVAGGLLTTSRMQVGDDRIWSRVLLGIIPELDLLGYKEFHRVDKRVHYHVVLFSRESGEHLGTVDGRRITSLRTAATAAIAVAHHAGSSGQRVGLIGSGEEAREGLRALHAAMPIESVAVYSPTAANRDQFASTMSKELGLPVMAVETPDDAAANPVLYVATSSTVPFLKAAQVGDVEVLAAIGSTRPDQRELHGDVIAAAGHVVIDCADARHEPGDMIDAVTNHGFDADATTLLGDDLEVPTGSRRRPVVFKSVGSVEQDLVLAEHLLRAAASSGIGTVAPAVASLRIMR
jgi:ornithine cyclodeaminase/alanine dehydrogenase-like protein (mu-crystallin family)